MINGVVRQLNFENQEFEVVMAGSTFKGGDLLIKPMQEKVWEFAEGAKFLRLEAPPVVGGVLLAMERAGEDGYAHRKTLVDTSFRFYNKYVDAP